MVREMYSMHAYRELLYLFLKLIGSLSIIPNHQSPFLLIPYRKLINPISINFFFSFRNSIPITSHFPSGLKYPLVTCPSLKMVLADRWAPGKS